MRPVAFTTMIRTTAAVALLVFAAALAWSQEKPKQPPVVDDELEFLLKKSSTAPATTAPATLPTGNANTPFKDRGDAEGKRKAVLTLSDGEKIRGRISTTFEKPIRVWESKAKEYRDIPFELIKTVEAKILWEREEKEWHFKESGSDLKEYTGKTYPARELEYVVTLVNGQSITGGVVAPIFIETLDGGDKTLTLNKRTKGDIGKTLKDLIYIKHIEFADVQK